MENYFKKLNTIKCIVEKKNNLNYVSWADSWAEVKKQFPESNYIIYENSEWFPFWESCFWIDVKVWVTINAIEHIVRLPVMDGANKSMKKEKYTYSTKYWEKEVQSASSFDINKAIQRAFTKAIAMHWIGLYIYRGEDLPEEPEKQDFSENDFENLKKRTNFKDFEEAKKQIMVKYNLSLTMEKKVKKYYEEK